MKRGWMLCMVAAVAVALLVLGLNGASAKAQKTPQLSTATPLPMSDCASGFGIVASPNAGTHSNFLEAISALSADDIWAVGYDAGDVYVSEPLIEHWDGTQWSVVPTLIHPSNFSGDLHAVSALSPSDVWAVGSRGMNNTLIEHWNGTEWSIVPSPDAGNYNILNGVSASSANDVWAVGTTGEGDEALIEHWDGTAWSTVAAPSLGSNSGSLQGVVALAVNDVWAVGYYSAQTSYEQGTLTEHWDGTVWRVVPSPNSPYYYNILRGVSGSGADDVWAVGDQVNDDTSLDTLVEHWNGTAWSIVDSPNPRVGSNTSHLQAVSALAPDNAWAVGYSVTTSGQNRTLVEHWNGIAWAVVVSANNGSGSSTLMGVSAHYSTSPPSSPSTDVWTVGNYNVSPPGALTLVEHYQGPCVTPTPTPIACNIHFTDLAPGSTFYPFVTCLACQGIVSGYSCGGSNPQDGGAEPCGATGYPYFRYNNAVTRGEISKIVAESAHLTGDAGVQVFEDVLPGSPFYTYINRLSVRGYISGYQCGGPGEPCRAGNRPYFRPGAPLSREELAKIVVEAAQIEEIQAGRIFEDVPQYSSFFPWIETLAVSRIVGGYPCGGIHEPCYRQNRPYYRPGANITRGQAAKIVSGAFFPGCTTLPTAALP